MPWILKLFLQLNRRLWRLDHNVGYQAVQALSDCDSVERAAALPPGS